MNLSQREAVKQAAERYKNDLDRELGLYGTDTGHHQLNLIINGWVGGKITSYCMRPAAGKTSSFIQMMKASGEQINNRRSQLLVFSWEAAAKDLISRYVSWETGFTQTQLKYPKMFSADQRKIVEEAYRKAQSFPVEYHQTPTNVRGIIKTLETFIEETTERSQVEGRHVQPVMLLDFISMLRSNSPSNRTYQIADLTQELKNFSEQKGLACFLLQQLNRTADAKDLPDLTDISDSQSIEQNSDTVIIGHRPEQLNRPEITDGSITMPSDGKILWRVLKNREGACGDYILNADVARNRFWTLDMQWNQPYNHLYSDPEFWKHRL